MSTTRMNNGKTSFGTSWVCLSRRLNSAPLEKRQKSSGISATLYFRITMTGNILRQLAGWLRILADIVEQIAEWFPEPPELE